jgi:molybdopterin adenylyltransferase
MEHIRTKYGSEIPGALLSRSIAALAGNTLIFALPGSVKAVNEYMTEILKVLEHLIFTVNGIDRH